MGKELSADNRSRGKTDPGLESRGLVINPIVQPFYSLRALTTSLMHLPMHVRLTKLMHFGTSVISTLSGLRHRHYRR